MIIYNPLDGDAFTSSIPSNPKHCFLMTRLGRPVPEMVNEIREAVSEVCEQYDYTLVDARAGVTGRDFLLKIWRMIASAPLSVGVVHEDIPPLTQANIYYEIGVAQAFGKETVIVKSPNSRVPSDFVRTEYLEFDESFSDTLSAYFDTLFAQADHYELVADQLDRNPILAIDYLKRAYLITGNEDLRNKAQLLVQEAGLEQRATNSVELLAAAF